MIYKLFIFFLPFISIGFFYNFLRGWSVNLSLYFLLFLLPLVLLKLFNKKFSFILRKKDSKIYFIVFLIFFLMIFSTVIMNIFFIFIDNEIDIRILNIMKIFFNVGIMIGIFIITFLYNNSISKALITLKYILYSSIFLIIYGYLQMLVMFRIPIFFDLYTYIHPIIDSGWAGEFREFNYLEWYFRINLTTPEASEASHVLTVLIIPFLLASLILKKSLIFKSFMVEKILFYLTLPILLMIFSTSGYFVIIIQIIAAFLLYKFYLSHSVNLLKLSLLLLFLIICVYFYLVYMNDLVNDPLFFLLKFLDMSNGSTNSRFTLTLTSLLVGFQYFLLGTGYGDKFVLMKDNLPSSAYSNAEILNSISEYDLPALNYWTDVFSSYGIFYLILYFLLQFIINYKLYIKSKYSEIAKYFFIAHTLYFIGTFLQGFNSMSNYFIYVWFLLFFFLVISLQRYQKHE